MDLGLEAASDDQLKARGISAQTHLANLDAAPGTSFADVLITLGCIGSEQIAYLIPYSFEEPAGVDTRTMGIWDTAKEDWVRNQVLHCHGPTVRDDGASITVFNQVQMRQIVAMIRKSVSLSLISDGVLILTAGMYAKNNDAIELWGDFDATGLDDALDYLPLLMTDFVNRLLGLAELGGLLTVRGNSQSNSLPTWQRHWRASLNGCQR